MNEKIIIDPAIFEEERLPHLEKLYSWIVENIPFSIQLGGIGFTDLEIKEVENLLKKHSNKSDHDPMLVGGLAVFLYRVKVFLDQVKNGLLDDIKERKLYQELIINSKQIDEIIFRTPGEDFKFKDKNIIQNWVKAAIKSYQLDTAEAMAHNINDWLGKKDGIPQFAYRIAYTLDELAKKHLPNVARGRFVADFYLLVELDSYAEDGKVSRHAKKGSVFFLPPKKPKKLS